MVEGLYDWLTKYAMNRARFDTRTGNCSLMGYFCANWLFCHEDGPPVEVGKEICPHVQVFPRFLCDTDEIMRLWHPIVKSISRLREACPGSTTTQAKLRVPIILCKVFKVNFGLVKYSLISERLFVTCRTGAVLPSSLNLAHNPEMRVPVWVKLFFPLPWALRCQRTCVRIAAAVPCSNHMHYSKW